MEKENRQLAVELRHALHQHPELSNEETWTKQYVMDFLKQHTDLEIVDKGNWFYAAYRVDETRPNIAFRADFDALPMDEVIDVPWASTQKGNAHKCGHDGHSATLAGFALEVDQKGAQNNLFFLFQPAEETGDGAIQCAELIDTEKIDEIFGYHNFSGFPFQTIAAKEGVTHYASKGMTIYLEGAPAHASQPEDGANPSLTIAQIIQSLPKFTSPERNKGETMATVVHVNAGEKAFGMAASKGELSLTIRAYYEKELDKLQENIEQLTKQWAEKEQLTVSFEYQDEFPETANHSKSVEKVRRAAKELGYPYQEMKEAYKSSEDFGYYTKRTSGAFFYIGNGEDYPNVHTSQYDFRDEHIERGVEMFKKLASYS